MQGVYVGYRRVAASQHRSIAALQHRDIYDGPRTGVGLAEVTIVMTM